MNFEWINNTYKVDAEYGREIMFQKKRKGIIIECQGNYIGVNLDDDKPGVISTLHPTWKVEYLGIGKVRKMTRSQRRYRDYINSDYGGDFAEYLGIY
jgi:hypothetical protein